MESFYLLLGVVCLSFEYVIFLNVLLKYFAYGRYMFETKKSSKHKHKENKLILKTKILLKLFKVNSHLFRRADF